MGSFHFRQSLDPQSYHVQRYLDRKFEFLRQLPQLRLHDLQRGFYILEKVIKHSSVPRVLPRIPLIRAFRAGSRPSNKIKLSSKPPEQFPS